MKNGIFHRRWCHGSCYNVSLLGELDDRYRPPSHPQKKQETPFSKLPHEKQRGRAKWGIRIGTYWIYMVNAGSATFSRVFPWVALGWKNTIHRPLPSVYLWYSRPPSPHQHFPAPPGRSWRFPGQMGYVIPSANSGSSTRSPHSWTRLEHLQRVGQTK